MTIKIPSSRLTWKFLGQDIQSIAVGQPGTGPVSPEWAWGGSTGAGVRVCVIDSGIEEGHPLVGAVARSCAVTRRDDAWTVTDVEHGDMCGHGTACASVIRRAAVDCEIHSLRILDAYGVGTDDALIAGLAWAVEQRFDVINLSLSTVRNRYKPVLRDLADEAYFNRSVIVASAHNARIESYPWRFSSVVSVGSHEYADSDMLLYNPHPPVEFFALGESVTVAGLGGTTTKSTGNSFATPQVSGLCARILSKHRNLTIFELKTVLYLTAANVRGDESWA